MSRTLGSLLTLITRRDFRIHVGRHCVLTCSDGRRECALDGWQMGRVDMREESRGMVVEDDVGDEVIMPQGGE